MREGSVDIAEQLQHAFIKTTAKAPTIRYRQMAIQGFW